MSEDEFNDEDREELFFRVIIPHAWAGILDLIHDVYNRLGEWLSDQAQVMKDTFGDEVSDVFTGEEPPEGGIVLPFPDKEKE